MILIIIIIVSDILTFQVLRFLNDITAQRDTYSTC